MNINWIFSILIISVGAVGIMSQNITFKMCAVLTMSCLLFIQVVLNFMGGSYGW